MKKILSFLLLLSACAGVFAQTAGRTVGGSSQVIDLAGRWQFSVGEEPVYNDEIRLPGSMLTNGKGEDVSLETQWVGSLYDSSYYFNPRMELYRREGNLKFPFFLTPKKHFVGTAWYKKSVDVPKSWKKRSVVLYLERPHIETTIYINGKEAGRDSSLSVPHVFDVTKFILPGKKNEIAIRVYNGIENVCVGQDSHSVTDQTQGDWNGIIGRMELQSRPQAYLDDVQVFPNVGEKTVKVRIKVVGKVSKSDIRLSIIDNRASGIGNRKPIIDNRESIFENRYSIIENQEAGVFEATIPMGDDVKLWDEFHPNLYTLRVTLGNGVKGKEKAFADERIVTFGMSEIAIKGRQFYMNGHPIWIRGTVGNCCFPLTGYPPTDEASWLEIFRKCKEYGLNMMRFHSYCPPEAAFSAADKVGFYLQPEGPSWPNHGVKLGRGMSIDKYLLQETERMVKAYGNHPSFCMLAAGNEPAGDWVKWVGEFVEHWQKTGDKRRVYCGASVGGGWAFDPKSEYHVKGGARGLDWDRQAPQSEDDYYQNITSFLQKGRTPITFQINEPLLSHEQGQWCAFPDLKERPQYTGAYKAYNFDIFADLLKDNGMESQAEKFLHASGKLQTLAYKYEMERNLRTPEYAGFQLLSLNDYSGQGTALVGVLNVFWREKGYCNAEDWTKFCAPVVPLAKFPKFVYTNDEMLNVPVELYNANGEPLRNAQAQYVIKSQGRVVAQSALTKLGDIELGKNHKLFTVNHPLKDELSPAKYTLSVTVLSDNASKAENCWDFWVYEPAPYVHEGEENVGFTHDDRFYETDTLDTKALEVLENGGTVLITAAGKVRYGNDVKQTYMPVFWNTSWFKMRPPHTTGATIDTAHPLFKARQSGDGRSESFPTDDWANLNWWELLNKAQVMNLSQLPKEYQSPVQPIDTWHVSRKLGMILEANVLNGKLLMTTMDITNNLEKRPVARQMRKAILCYLGSEDFAPAITLEPQVITNLFENTAPPVNMFTKDSPDELKPKLK